MCYDMYNKEEIKQQRETKAEKSNLCQTHTIKESKNDF